MNKRIITINIALFAALAYGGCLAPTEDEEITPAQQQALAEDTVEALQVVGSIAHEIGGLAEEPPTEADDGQPAPAPAGSTDGAPAPCATIRWIPLSVRFDACELPDGRIVDGTMRLTLDYEGERGAVGVHADTLRVGAPPSTASSSCRATAPTSRSTPTSRTSIPTPTCASCSPRRT